MREEAEMASTLPDNPSLEWLRASARRLQRGVISDQADALATVCLLYTSDAADE